MQYAVPSKANTVFTLLARLTRQAEKARSIIHHHERMIDQDVIRKAMGKLYAAERLGDILNKWADTSAAQSRSIIRSAVVRFSHGLHADAISVDFPMLIENDKTTVTLAFKDDDGTQLVFEKSLLVTRNGMDFPTYSAAEHERITLDGVPVTPECHQYLATNLTRSLVDFANRKLELPFAYSHDTLKAARDVLYEIASLSGELERADRVLGRGFQTTPVMTLNI